MFHYLPSRITHSTWLLAGLTCVCITVSALGAQASVPVLTTASSALTGNRPVSAYEAAYEVRQRQMQVELAISFRNPHYPIDSLRQLVAERANAWLQRLNTQSLRGLYHDPAGQIGVAANRDEYAETQIAERLRASGLSVQDRAYTLLVGVQAFADSHVPARLPIAERYLAQLFALGADAGDWQFDASAALQRAYYLLGRSADVTRLGMSALEHQTRRPYIDAFKSGEGRVYGYTVEALAGARDGQARIDTLNTMLRSVVDPPPAIIALDSAYARRERKWRNAITEKWISSNHMLGTVGKPFVANYWVNRPTHDSAMVRLDDGKIRVVEMFSYGCDGCLKAIHGLQRLKQQFPTADIFVLTWTMGFWANRLVEPQEEVKHLEHFFTQELNVTIPVGIWMEPKHVADDGGVTPGMWNGPNNNNYPTLAKPTIWMFDGHGRLRSIILGYSREQETLLAQKLEYLQREAANQTESAGASEM